MKSSIQAFAGRWPSHLQFTIDRFYRLGGVAIKLEIIVLFAATESVEIRLIPDFKEPLANFDQAIALDPVGDQLADQHRPLRVVLRRSDIGTIMENRLIAGRQDAGHEAQLDERLHADRKQKVEDRSEEHTSE